MCFDGQSIFIGEFDQESDAVEAHRQHLESVNAEKDALNRAIDTAKKLRENRQEYANRILQEAVLCDIKYGYSQQYV